MKKKILLLLVVIVLGSLCFAKGTEEVSQVNLAVMQGPTGFSSVMLPSYVNISVYPSPNEAVAKLINGELDMAVLPANTAANLYNKGVGIRALAIVGEGMLSVVGTDVNTDTIAVPGAGGTPDHMATLLYPQYEKSYSVAAPAQLAQLLIAGKCPLAILPQPFVNMVLGKNPNVKILGNVQEEWEKHTGTSQFPMSVLVVADSFIKSNAKLVENVKKDYAASIEKVLGSVSEAAAKIEEVGIMSASLAENAIADCAIVFKDGKQAKKELVRYFDILINLDSKAIGGKLPDSEFYL